MIVDGSVSRRACRGSAGAAGHASRAGGSFVACETVERLKQRIDNRLAERLCFLTDLGFASVAGGGGEFRTLSVRIALARSIAHCAKSSRLSMILVSINARSRV
ncbi:hypothetical protein AJ88_43200 [Mesorhizobium amorphae CCBAU 01583]|nr:hypothetical protein AJ88_43200 [Mesorhizobium amorphae CCBAU 01583]